MAVRIALLAGLAVVGLGCSPDGSVERSAVTTSQQPTIADDEAGSATVTGPDDGIDEPASAEVVAELARLPGLLAVGVGPGLAVVSPDGSDVTWLEDGADVLAAQPTWSNDGGRLAWSRATAAGQELMVRDLEQDDQVATPIDGTPIFYLQWSSDDTGLAYLRSDAAGRGVEMGLIEPGLGAVPIGATQPFFVSWAPTSSSLALHVTQRQVIVLPNVFAAPDAADAADAPGAPDSGDAQASVVVEPTGQFTVPAWVDERTLLVATADGLALVDIETSRSVVQVATEDRVEFLLSPDRSKVAYWVQSDDADSAVIVQTGTQGPTQGPASGGLGVLDLASGETTMVTDLVPLAWEWSPDSSKLAWLAAGASGIRPSTGWHFWNGTDSLASVDFHLSDQTRTVYLPFFEQYAQSQRHWSPDSEAFAFAGRVDSSEAADGIWIQLVDIDAPPVRIADGDVVTWSS